MENFKAYNLFYVVSCGRRVLSDHAIIPHYDEINAATALFNILIQKYSSWSHISIQRTDNPKREQYLITAERNAIKE